MFYKFKIHRKEYEIKLEKREKENQETVLESFPLTLRADFLPPKD